MGALGLLPSASWALDLVQAYQNALTIDPVVASTQAQLAATREKIPQARAGLLPALTGNAIVNSQATDTSITRSRDFVTQNYSVNLTYPLYRMQNVETFEQSKLQVAVGEAQLSQAQSDLIVRVAQAYFDVLAAQDSLATIRAQKTAIT
jgi:outer membrane protein